MAPDTGIEIAIPPALAARDRREVFRIEDLPAADLSPILEGEMDPKYDYLNAELD